MKKVFIIFLLCLLFSANCQKKEEMDVRKKIPSGPINGQSEIRLLEEAVRQDPKNVNAWIGLGNMLMDNSRFYEAIDAYQKALEINPRNLDVIVDMGTCYRGVGKPERAVEEYKKAIAINPAHIYAHRNLGTVLLFDLGDKKQAIKEFEAYLKLSPNAPDAQEIKQYITRLKAST